MALPRRLLASGPGWRAEDVVCTCGPHDRSFEEQHEDACIAAVTGGSFQYRSTLGSAVLTPGALVLGNQRQAFQCSHEHGIGDRCLAFHFTPAFLEGVAATVPGARHITFTTPRLPPDPALSSIVAAAESARDERDQAELEEVALRLAGAVAAAWRKPSGARRRRTGWTSDESRLRFA
jgi:AraC family transcriptional regulator